MVLRRLELVEQTLDNVVGKLNEFLVLHHENNRHVAANETSS